MASLSRLDFYNYLSSLPAGKPFATSGSPTCCPIARYLAKIGVAEPLVHEGGFVVDGVRTPLPEWAQQFVATMDSASDCSLALTPLMALQALNGVTRWWNAEAQS